MSASASAPARTSAFVIAVAAVAAVSGLLFGFDIAVINGALVLMRAEFQLSAQGTEIAAGSLLVGCVFGAAAAGWLTDRFGRRRVIGLAALLFGLSSVAAALPHDLTQFVIARLIGGLGIGTASVLAPIYIAEVAPAAVRGRLVSFNQLAIVIGILIAYFVNWGLASFGEAGWRYMFAVALIPSVALAVALIWTPESPRWLAGRGRDAQALGVLRRTLGDEGATAELAAIRTTMAEETGTTADLFGKLYRPRILLAVALAILQQFSGVNAVLFYGSVILKDSLGLSDSDAIGANVLLGVVNLAATLIALPLVDRIGRKPLLLFSAGTMAVCQLVLGWAFLAAKPDATIVVAAMLTGVAAFAVGLGPCYWVLVSEIFPSRLRGRAMSIATVALWLASLLLTVTFLTLTGAIGAAGTFWLYAAMCGLIVLIVLRYVPETKGRTLEDIERHWRR